MDTSKPSLKAIKEAKKISNGWVYVIDEAFETQSDVPPQAILGAWKVDGNGKIIGNFIPNPQYIYFKDL